LTCRCCAAAWACRLDQAHIDLRHTLAALGLRGGLKACERQVGLPHLITAADIDIRDDYIGEGYGVVTPGSREALALLAHTEAILLDPVYTGKAMAGLIDDARHGRLGATGQVVFVHTGGTPAVFAYRDELMG
jgi:1-aminocyclopropane-1-carboxylate deaminase/D-cysteine desulfhydrase-like pyridoxal-dependent ACC family enzyme